MATIATNCPNPTKIGLTLTTTDTGTLGPYRFRGGKSAPATLRLHAGDVGADGTWTVSLKVGAAGGATGDLVTIESYTSLTSKVFDPGGNCDVYLDCTAHGGTSTLYLEIAK
jgi:hypothetical protein